MKAATVDPGATSIVAANAAALATTKVFTSGLLFAWQIVLGRALGSTAYGVYGTIGALMAVGAAFADLGTGTIVVRDVARSPELARRYFFSALALQTVLASAAYVILQAGAAVLGYDADLLALLLFAGINLLIDAIGTAGHNQLVAAERMWQTGAVSAAHVAVLVALGGLALALGGGLWAIYAALVGASVIRAGLYLAAAPRANNAPGPAVPIDPALARRILGAGLPLGVAAILSLAFMHADKLVTTAILGVEATGQLTAAFVLVFGLAELVGTTLLVATLPAMSRRAAHDTPDASGAMLESLIHVVLLVGLPAAALVAWLGGGFVQVLFGSQYAAAGAILHVLGWCIVVRPLEGALAQALLVKDRQRSVLVARVGGLVLNLALTIALLPRIGIMGAATGTVAGEVAMAAGMLAFVAPPAEWRRRVVRRALRLVGPVVVLGAAVAVAASRLPVPATAIVALVAYAAAATLTGAVSRDDVSILLRAVPAGLRSRPS